MGFDIAPGSILAVSYAIKIELDTGGSLYSVIDLVADRKVDDGAFTIVLDENRIKIYVSTEDKKRIEGASSPRRHEPREVHIVPSLISSCGY